MNDVGQALKYIKEWEQKKQHKAHDSEYTADEWASPAFSLHPEQRSLAGPDYRPLLQDP